MLALSRDVAGTLVVRGADAAALRIADETVAEGEVRRARSGRTGYSGSTNSSSPSRTTTGSPARAARPSGRSGSVVS